jgi:hypothetical protein
MLRCRGFAELELGAEVRAEVEVEAWPFVVIGCQWLHGDTIAGTGGHAGERGRRLTWAQTLVIDRASGWVGVVLSWCCCWTGQGGTCH